VKIWVFLKFQQKTPFTHSRLLLNQMIKYEGFANLDIRIGTIIEAEKIENTDKLLKLIVDLGEETRQIVAGIANFYTPKELIGHQIPVIVNLEPAVIRGVESNGMLMAIDDNQVTLLVPQNQVPNGSKIK
jgi:methionyl-tRNA synthetase